jgi:glycosyltransferase involved in cell wall biosynthesis
MTTVAATPQTTPGDAAGAASALHPVSVVILTKNEEINIGRCLEALSFSDDIVVYDSFSTDRTLEIARAQPNVTVVQRKFDNWAAHQNWGVENIAFKHPWVLYVDADEIVEPELAEEVRRAADPASRFSAFKMRRKDMFMGRWLRRAQMYPVWLVRMFRPSKIRYERLVNPVAVVDGPVGHLQNRLIHYPFSKGVEQWFERHNSYSSFEAQELLKVRAGNRQPLIHCLSLDTNKRRAAMKDLYYHMPFRPQIKWFYYMFVRQAWLDGKPGIAYARMVYLYEYMTTIKVMEATARKRRGEDGRGAEAGGKGTRGPGTRGQ